jgi:hypothetical protein
MAKNKTVVRDVNGKDVSNEWWYLLLKKHHDQTNGMNPEQLNQYLDQLSKTDLERLIASRWVFDSLVRRAPLAEKLVQEYVGRVIFQKRQRKKLREAQQKKIKLRRKRA